MKDIDKNSLDEALARNTLDDIPAPKSNAKEIIGLTKNRLPDTSCPTAPQSLRRKALPWQRTATSKASALPTGRTPNI